MRRVIKVILIFLLTVFLVHGCTSYAVVDTVRINSYSMAPEFMPGDRLIIMPVLYGVRIPYTDFYSPQVVHPKRGDVIIVRNPDIPEQEWYIRIIDKMTQFLTGQYYSLFESKSRLYDNRLVLRRIIAIPGDEVTMIENKAYVKPQGSTTYLPEDQMIPLDYSITLPDRSGDWDWSLPFTGDVESIKLAENEYFVLCDDRHALEDSRAWGAVALDVIRGKKIARYYRKMNVRDDTP